MREFHRHRGARLRLAHFVAADLAFDHPHSLGAGSAYHALVELAPWIPGGLDILMGEHFLAPRVEG